MMMNMMQLNILKELEDKNMFWTSTYIFQMEGGAVVVAVVVLALVEEALDLADNLVIALTMNRYIYFICFIKLRILNRYF